MNLFLSGFQIGDLKKDLKELKDSPISDKEIKQGIESFKADFDNFKQLALQQYKEQQKLEREQQKTMSYKGMSR
jgi:hypothetical protein